MHVLTFSMPGKRKGWLDALRSCANRLISLLLSIDRAIDSAPPVSSEVVAVLVVVVISPV